MLGAVQYFAYNTVLRQHPQDIFQQFKSSNCLFPTTIHVLVSALNKISRVTEMKPGMRLYRGLGWKADLPELFFDADEHGCSGFTEWGFMSTTAKKEVAIEYSKIQEGNPLPRVLLISIGSVDRGACLTAFSQYQEEEEYLYAPFSFVEKCGQEFVEATAHGVVEVIPVRVNANIKTKTVEELVDQKKIMHLTAFNYLVHEIENELAEAAGGINGRAERRLACDKTREANHTVTGFISKIVEQCRDVESRHKAVSSHLYVKDQVFRGLVLEMIDVKLMAVSKMREWLENTSYSFIRFRWGAALRTAHRRYIAYLEKELRQTEGDADPGQGDDEGRKAASLQLCQCMGLMVDSVDEVNELGETRLMCSAAEGRATRILKLFVGAGASINAGRPDGVTPMWLAAQFGHEGCIRSLHQLKASVSQAANDGATPICIAAQNGNAECIRVLAELKADPKQADKKGFGPVHQAAMNGHTDCVAALIELNADIEEESGRGSPLQLARETRHDKCAEYIVSKIRGRVGVHSWSTSAAVVEAREPLIITTGDVSDIDGFLALAEYSKTGSDVMFIMNYPAYIAVNEAAVDLAYDESNPGLGFKYNAKVVLGRKEKFPVPDGYNVFLEKYRLGNNDDNEVMKSALTDLAFEMAVGIWKEGPASRGQLYFCVGGINSINPFSESAIKNEVMVYHSLIEPRDSPLTTKQGLTYDQEGDLCHVDFKKYAEIYMDFNGSLAFWDDSWFHKLSDSCVVQKIRGVFIMGGVLSDKDPVTMPSIPKVLNRFSSATMNQLYHPQNAADFFSFLQLYKIPSYVVTNNAVGDITTFKDDEKTKTFAGVELFLKSNGLTGNFLGRLAQAHYESVFNPPRKPFDYYTAFALTSAMGDKMERLRTSDSKMFYYSNVYGISVVSSHDTWQAARDEYVSHINTRPTTDDDVARNRYKLFQNEIKIMKKVDRMASLEVFDLRFSLDDEKKLRLENSRA